MQLSKRIWEKLKQIANNKYVSGSILAIITFIIILKNQSPQLALSQFLNSRFLMVDLNSNNVEMVRVCGNGDQIMFRLKNNPLNYLTDISILSKDQLYKLLTRNKGLYFDSIIISQKMILYASTMISFAFFALSYTYNRNIQQKAFSPPPAEKQNTFKDVYGHQDAKQSLLEIISFLKNSKEYKDIGARLRKGILLHGPPGTGKTLLARATAGEASAVFFSIAASELIEIYAGTGALRIRQLFAKARKCQPSIIFIDEIDSIGSKSENSLQSSHQERDSTLNQLLTEMDGFRGNENIVVIAATNRLKILDTALIRSGRFDLKLEIQLPNLQERLGILKLHLLQKKHQISEEILVQISDQSNNYSGADLEALLNESAYKAISNKRNVITDNDLLQSFNRMKSMKAQQM